jgi:hypothetical protein
MDERKPLQAFALQSAAILTALKLGVDRLYNNCGVGSVGLEY